MVCGRFCVPYRRHPELIDIALGDNSRIQQIRNHSRRLEFDQSISLRTQHCCFYHWLLLLKGGPPKLESVPERRLSTKPYIPKHRRPLLKKKKKKEEKKKKKKSTKMAADSSSSSKSVIAKNKKSMEIEVAADSSSSKPASLLDLCSGHSESHHQLVKCSTSTAAAFDGAADSVKAVLERPQQ